METTWNSLEKPKKYPALEKNLTVDVAVIGGGLAGINCAYLLAREGRRVAVLECNEIGSGVTAYTTALVTQAIDTRLSDLKKMFGPEQADLIWQSGADAISAMEKLIAEEKIDCEFMRCPAFVYANTPAQVSQLQQEAQAARESGFAAEFNEKNNLGFRNAGYLEIPGQAKFHPLKYLYALADRAQERGALIFENSEAVDISGEGPVLIRTKNGVITANDVIVATYKAFNDPKETRFKKGMYTSYVYEVSMLAKNIPEAIFWDMDNPYHYLRIDKKEGSDRMIIGGEDHREEIKMDQEKNFRALEEYLETILPGQERELVRRWDGPILEPSDGAALIGSFRPHQYLASSFSGNGMTYSIMSGILIRDLILGRENPWAKIYDPRRIPKIAAIWEKAKDYTSEFVGGVLKNLWK